MKLKPDERDLTGDWLVINRGVVGDSVSQRIKSLISEHLQKIATDATGWDILYKDPEDGRHWELTYPQSEMHGGGPPRLTYLSDEQARAKYGDVVK